VRSGQIGALVVGTAVAGAIALTIYYVRHHAVVKEIGGDCRSSDECETKLCMTGAEGVGFCTRTCQTNTDCGRRARCSTTAVAGGSYCERDGHAAVGEGCWNDGDCATDRCLHDANGAMPRCSMSCATDADCPGDAVCDDVFGTQLCLSDQMARERHIQPRLRSP
jgi:hypothetical protein